MSLPSAAAVSPSLAPFTYAGTCVGCIANWDRGKTQNVFVHTCGRDFCSAVSCKNPRTQSERCRELFNGYGFCGRHKHYRATTRLETGRSSVRLRSPAPPGPGPRQALASYRVCTSHLGSDVRCSSSSCRGQIASGDARIQALRGSWYNFHARCLPPKDAARVLWEGFESLAGVSSLSIQQQMDVEADLLSRVPARAAPTPVLPAKRQPPPPPPVPSKRRRLSSAASTSTSTSSASTSSLLADVRAAVSQASLARPWIPAAPPPPPPPPPPPSPPPPPHVLQLDLDAAMSHPAPDPFLAENERLVALVAQQVASFETQAGAAVRDSFSWIPEPSEMTQLARAAASSNTAGAIVKMEDGEPGVGDALRDLQAASECSNASMVAIKLEYE
ncbi:hypothetical protein TeGR_g1712 [Tetraparma gracilis]|uniref:Uncharacterized protein n=1 Tax=Tetraparma gracilis TaxID=2962635 RepID=A0ABQ6MM85_9STRA|nr:hypothetical protein TeGR_g1712 [Tetraparma gracilis]